MLARSVTTIFWYSPRDGMPTPGLRIMACFIGRHAGDTLMQESCYDPQKGFAYERASWMGETKYRCYAWAPLPLQPSPSDFDLEVEE